MSDCLWLFPSWTSRIATVCAISILVLVSNNDISDRIAGYVDAKQKLAQVNTLAARQEALARMAQGSIKRGPIHPSALLDARSVGSVTRNPPAAHNF